VELRTGIDLIEISRLGGLNPAIRRRFLARVFTPLELELSQNDASLAGRFAAKEAVAKALGCGIGTVRWQEIEVSRGTNGEPCLVLHGAAAQEAQQQRLVTWSISITHTATHAAAVAVALGPAEHANARGEHDLP
jgi:holo-[acyl-carrier protein] synthase